MTWLERGDISCCLRFLVMGRRNQCTEWCAVQKSESYYTKDTAPLQQCTTPDAGANPLKPHQRGCMQLISLKYSLLAKHAGRVQRLLSVNVQYAMNMHMTSRRRQWCLADHQHGLFQVHGERRRPDARSLLWLSHVTSTGPCDLWQWASICRWAIQKLHHGMGIWVSHLLSMAPKSQRQSWVCRPNRKEPVQ